MMTSNKPKNQINELGLELGFAVENWTGANCPDNKTLVGQYCQCQPLDIDKHSESLFHAYDADTENRVWVYLPYGPFSNLMEYQDWLRTNYLKDDPFFYAIVDNQSGKAIGVASYLRINPDAGSIEVGHINYSPALQNSIAASEAMYLLMKNAFDLGYRRYQWKCNSLNEKSCNAALRLGFTFEGIFRQMLVVKGQNRDSAWYSLLDREWPEVRKAFEQWLDEDNFDADGVQIQSLSKMTATALAKINAE